MFLDSVLNSPVNSKPRGKEKEERKEGSMDLGLSNTMTQITAGSLCVIIISSLPVLFLSLPVSVRRFPRASLSGQYKYKGGRL